LAYQAWIAVAIVLAAVAAVFDHRTGKIPNQLTMGFIAGAPLAHAVTALQVEPTWQAASVAAGGSLAGAAIGALLPLLLMRVGAMGAGDVKLFAALGAVAGAGFMMHAETYAFLFAMTHGLVVVARKKALSSTFRNTALLFARPLRKGAPKPALDQMTQIRLAPSVLAGCCVASAVLWRA
jgi:prepilin peptidase CpaA